MRRFAVRIRLRSVTAMLEDQVLTQRLSPDAALRRRRPDMKLGSPRRTSKRSRSSSRRRPRSAAGGKIATRWALPTSFGALREALALAERHRDMAVLLFPPMPPRVVQLLPLPRHNHP